MFLTVFGYSTYETSDNNLDAQLYVTLVKIILFWYAHAEHYFAVVHGMYVFTLRMDLFQPIMFPQTPCHYKSQVVGRITPAVI